MNKNEIRLKRSKSNVIWMVLYQITLVLTNILIRKVFLTHIGLEYLGIDGVLNSIIGIMQIFEFGIGSSACYYLIKAFAAEDDVELSAIYQAYISLSRKIVALFLGLNIFVCFILRYIVSFDYNQALLYFVLNVVDKAIFLIYIRDTSVIIYNQENDYIHKITILLTLFFFFIKVFLLPMIPSFVFFLVLRLLQSILAMLLCRYKASKIIPKLEIDPLLVQEKNKEIVDYAVKNFIVILITIIFLYKDNIIIELVLKLDGVKEVGLMSNYQTISLSVSNLAIGIFTSISASISNFINDKQENNEQNLISLLDKLNVLAFMIASFTGLGLYGLSNEFIGIVYGSEYVLNNLFILFLSSSLMLVIFQQAFIIYITAKGLLYKETVYSILMLLVSIVLGVYLTKYYGATGVVISTFVANAIKLVGDVVIVDQYFQTSLRKSYVKMAYFFVILLLQFTALTLLYTFSFNTIPLFIVKGIAVGIVYVIGFLFVYTKEKDAIYSLFNRLKKR